MFPYDEVAGLGKKYSMFYVDSFHWGCSMGNKQESFHKNLGMAIWRLEMRLKF